MKDWPETIQSKVTTRPAQNWVWIGGVWNGHFRSSKDIFQRPESARKFLRNSAGELISFKCQGLKFENSEPEKPQLFLTPSLSTVIPPLDSLLTMLFSTFRSAKVKMSLRENQWIQSQDGDLELGQLSLEPRRHPRLLAILKILETRKPPNPPKFKVAQSD